LYCLSLPNMLTARALHSIGRRLFG
jgi:hypothetical protein